ncbi:MAG: transposase [Holosporales bacterium]|nr:transposase [Holosporales bacterium]
MTWWLGSYARKPLTPGNGYWHETGHPEPWVVVMDDEPTQAKILAYSMRWGIECLFSDLKGQGFDLESTHIRDVKRIENLMSVPERSEPL